ncbi:hypothetical protein C0J52_06381, partial [Blattella germanica]
HIVGLVNLGYTCFLNTLLQAFGSCPVVIDWLSKQDPSKKNNLSSSLLTTLKDPFTPSTLIQALLTQGWVISPGEQDAHELFHVIVTTLEEETQMPLTKVCSLYDAVAVGPKEVQSEVFEQKSQPKPLRTTVSCLDTSSALKGSRYKTPLPFHGLFTSQLQCVSCKHKSAVHYTTFYSLSLVLPPRKVSFNSPFNKFFTLDELIGNYVTSRVVNNVSCDGCGCPDTDQLPSCLCIHIARTTWEGEAKKRDDYIDFPEYKHLYQLVAVVVHKGSLSNGHFITYRRGVGRSFNSWYFTSDTEVQETSIYEVMQASAYMLFYTKFTSAVPPFAVV